MLDSIRIKRGRKSDLPESLPVGEQAFCTDTGELFVGTGTSIKKVVDQEVYTQLLQSVKEIGAIKTDYAKKADVNSLSSNKAEKTDLQTTNTELAVQKARMDTFASLTNGSTTGDAELIDGRIGADAITYTNVGGAIRTQITNIQNKIDNESIAKYDVIKGIGWYGTNGAFETNLDYVSTKKVRLQPNRTYKIITNSTIVARVFFNESGFVSGEYTSSNEFTMPSNANIVVFDFFYDINFKSLTIVDITDIKPLNDAVSKIKDEISMIQSEVDTIQSEVDTKEVDCFGDSITHGQGASSDAKSYPTTLQTMLGDKYKVNNFGVSGALMSSVTARLGGIPVILANDIVFGVGETVKTLINPIESDIFSSTYPYTVPNPTNLISVEGNQDFNSCVIDGVNCQIVISRDGGTGIYTLTINLLDANVNGITLHKDSVVYFSGIKNAQKGIVVLMMGTNGEYKGNTIQERAIDYVTQYKKCADSLGHGKYIMLSQFNMGVSTTYDGYKANQNIALLTEIEKQMFNEFGLKFINMRKELVKHGLNHAINGGFLTSSALSEVNNVDAISQGIVPPSLLLSADHLHPNDAGYYAIACIVEKTIKGLGF